MKTLDQSLATLERTRDDFKRAALVVRALGVGGGIDVDRAAGLLEEIAHQIDTAASGVRFLLQEVDASTPETRAIALSRLFGAS